MYILTYRKDLIKMKLKSIAAALIAFSRLYMFLHFPTDVLFGTALGIALGVLASRITKALWKRFARGETT